MEKVLSIDERIKKAEEIYYRRRMNSEGRDILKEKSSRKEYGLLKKVFLQIAICAIVYVIIYLIQTTNYVFSSSFLDKTNQILTYDLNFKEIYNNSFNYINELLHLDKKQEGKEEEVKETENVENLEDIQEENNNEEIQEEQIVEELTQEEQDVKYVLENYPMIVPVYGTITSRFGERESTNPIVSKYHTGIDIAVNTGTSFIASMSGKVVEVSSEGPYGVHVVVGDGEISTLYAHLQTAFVEEGENITQGQELGLTGSTGNATGPHLHFEIIRSGRYINPDLILQF